ncbi:transposase [Nesterenkonia sp. AN1]|nr:transposase [Nesterenkonia sp. AN1]
MAIDSSTPRSIAPSSSACASTSRPSPTSPEEPPRARANARSSAASNATSSARSTTSSRSTPEPAKSPVDNYRSANALAETVNGYYKAELIRGPVRAQRGPWKTVEDVELATLGWVHWHNTERLHGYLGDRPPAEFEALFYDDNTRSAELVESL